MSRIKKTLGDIASKIRNIKLSTVGEVLILLGIVALVVAAFLIHTVLGLVALGVALIIVGYLLLKISAIKWGITLNLGGGD